MNQKAKSILLNVIKLSIAVGIVTWMIRSGKIDFKELSFFIEQPIALLVPFLGWSILLLLLGAYRWLLLLRGIGLETDYKRVVQLHWIGLFFNTTMPGAVGGDLIKAVYVIKDHKEYRTKAMLTILLDRILGLMGLFTLGGIMALFNLKAFLNNPALSTLIFIVLGVCCGIVVFFVLVFLKVDHSKDPVMRLLSKKVPGLSILRKIYEALLVYKQKPWVLVQAWLLSVLLQGYVLSIFIFFTYMINGEMPPVGTLVPAIPVALLLTALPLAPAGMGVGHVAFGQVFRFAGVANGANVFNAYMLINLVMNLTGIFAYLMFKSKTNVVSATEALEVNS